MMELRQPRAAGLRLGWAATSVPVAPLLLTGMAIGPAGLGLLSPDALAFLDPVVPVAIGVLGALVGLTVGAHRAGDGRLLVAAVIESALTGVVVGAGMLAIAPRIFTDPPPAMWMMLAIFGGICAATSLAMPAGTPAAPGEDGRRLIELDAPLVAAAGGLVLVMMQGGPPLPTLTLAAEAAGAMLVLAAAGWLLLTQAASATEERVFTLAALLLVIGAADYLSVPALLGGLLAGIFWQRAGGPARELIRRDALYVQHPLLVLLLLVAGARVEFGYAAVGLAVAYAFLRATAKIGGGWIARRLVGIAARDVTARLLPPGILGIAFALNAVRLFGPDVSVLLTVAVTGTAFAEVLAAVLNHGEVIE